MTGLEDAVNKGATLLKNAIQTVESRFVFVGVQDDIFFFRSPFFFVVAGKTTRA